MNRANDASQLSIWLNRAIIFWLFVFALFAPHSIAVTQGAWLIGMLLWVIRLFVLLVDFHFILSIIFFF